MSTRESGNTAIAGDVDRCGRPKTIGPFVEGQALTAHIAQFIRVEADRIASIETYDGDARARSPTHALEGTALVR